MRISNNLGVTGKAQGIMMKILEVAYKEKMTQGRSPNGLASAIVYVGGVLTNERHTQAEIAEVANVTEVTIRNRYKELIERLVFEVYL